MADFISLAKPLQLTTPGTAPIAGLVVANTEELQAIDSPWLGMIVFVEADGKSYRVTKLKEVSTGGPYSKQAVETWEEVGADLSSLDEKYAPKEHNHDEKYAPLEDGKLPESCLPEKIAEAAAKPATITLPVPFDENDDNLSLVIDFDEDGTFTEENYTRVTMAKHFAKMKVFQGDKYVALDATGVGKPVYGQSVTFTLDEEMFPGYVAGKTYFARYCWLDSKQGRSEWKGFRFSGDVTDFEPIRLPEVEGISLFSCPAVMPHGEGTPEFDFLNGQVQTLTNMDQLTIDLAKVRNIPFGESLILVVNCFTVDNQMTVTLGRDSSVYPGDATYMVVILNLGQLYVTVNQTLN